MLTCSAISDGQTVSCKTNLLNIDLWVAEFRFQKSVYRVSTDGSVGQCRSFRTSLRKCCWLEVDYVAVAVCSLLDDLAVVQVSSCISPACLICMLDLISVHARPSSFLGTKAISSLFVEPTQE